MALVFSLLRQKESEAGTTKKKKKKKKKQAQDSIPGSKESVKTLEHRPSTDSLNVVKTIITPVPNPSNQNQPPKKIEYDLFTGHQLVPRSQDFKLKKTAEDNWFPLVMIFIFLLLSLVNLFYQKKFREFIYSLFRSAGSGVVREENVFTQRLRVLLFIIFTLVATSFAYQAAEFFNLRPAKLTSFQFFSVLLFIVFCVYLFKVTLVKVMGFILKTEKENSEYANNIVLFLNILTFGLLPLVILIGFSPGVSQELLIKTGAVFIFSAICFRIIRGYVIVVSNPGVSGFYLFLYLCTLEILPLVVTIKFFADQLF